MPVTVGGGIRTLDDIRALLNAGADKVSINSAAVKDPEFVRAASRRFGRQCIVVNIDPKRVERDGREVWEVHINGGRVPTGLEAVAWAREVERLGAGEIVLTSMDADGTQNGYDLPMTRAVAAAVEVPVVASGGAGQPEHLRAVLTDGGASAALAASIFHYRQYSIAETKEYLARHGVPVRLVAAAASGGGASLADRRPIVRTYVPRSVIQAERRVEAFPHSIPLGSWSSGSAIRSYPDSARSSRSTSPWQQASRSKPRRERTSPRPTSCSAWS